LITLTKEFNAFGNVVYRSVDYDFSLVIEGNSNDGTYTKNTNYELHGTIVKGKNNASGSHTASGNTSENMNNGY
jgi:hypothetical protein